MTWTSQHWLVLALLLIICAQLIVIIHLIDRLHTAERGGSKRKYRIMRIELARARVNRARFK